MSEHKGWAAIELFTGHAALWNCNNIKLLKRLHKETKRKSLSSSTDNDTVVSQPDLPEWLPTKKKVQCALDTIEVRELLFCLCNLCQNKDDKENERQFDSMISNPDIFHSDNIDGLGALIFCGCLFALKAFCNQSIESPLSTLGKQFTHDSPLPPSLSSLFERLSSSEPRLCQHAFAKDEDAFGRMESGYDQQPCVDCLGHAFRAAVTLWRKVLNIPILDSTSPLFMDKTDQNLPIICQKRIHLGRNSTNLSVEFYSSKIQAGYCRPSKLENQELFRKVYKYQPNERVFLDCAIKEANIAIKLASLHHRNIVSVLFAFEWKCLHFNYVELIFPRHEGDLGNLLSGHYRPPDHQSSSVDVFDNPLWQAAIDMLEALAVMHDEIEKERIDCEGHFDIKPANILIKEYNDKNVTLLLADFGQAAKHRAGTYDYGPPEVHVESNTRTESLSLAYDVWSMACVLLQVLIFIKEGHQGITQFEDDRFDNSNAAFWQGSGPENTMLRPAVTARLRLIETHDDSRARPIVAELRAMFTIDPTQRPTATSCLARLRCPRGQHLIQSGLERWGISSGSDSRPAKLHLYRDQPDRIRQGHEDEEITLNNHLMKCETKAVKSVSFVPLAFFDSEPNRGNVFKCRFQNLHNGTTFGFTRLDEFLKFMKLMTHQEVVPVETNNPVSGTEIHISSSSMKNKGRFIMSQTSKFKEGRLQVWKQVTQDEYSVLYPRWPASSANDSRITRHENVWKMALWTTDMSNQRVCVVVDIGTKSWEMDIPQNPTLLRLKQMPNKDFRGAVLEPLNRNEDSNLSREEYPGFPISPGRLLTKLRLQLKKLDINFASAEDRGNLIKILRNNGFPTND